MVIVSSMVQAAITLVDARIRGKFTGAWRILDRGTRARLPFAPIFSQSFAAMSNGRSYVREVRNRSSQGVVGWPVCSAMARNSTFAG